MPNERSRVPDERFRVPNERSRVPNERFLVPNERGGMACRDAERCRPARHQPKSAGSVPS
ncbi:hypothetical protein LX12_004004 [Williamsia serinedens]|uniref:Uncharacterized protein n=1 Tax=Williamsia serinedens TaxID=391736 RepID=A0ABT1H7U3_9NOCA|nr:hypothetical protein [Williamsia serinedens]